MGEGYECGELDMTLHWSHCALMQRGAELQTRCRAAAPRPATDQLNQGSAEDALRLGNLAELKVGVRARARARGRGKGRVRVWVRVRVRVRVTYP